MLAISDSVSNNIIFVDFFYSLFMGVLFAAAEGCYEYGIDWEHDLHYQKKKPKHDKNALC